MFTGIIQFLAKVAEVRNEPPGKRLLIACPELCTDAALGDSIAINGCCLTVVSNDGRQLGFEAGPETLSRTTLGKLAAGSPVNLEPSLRMSDRLGGHFVTGHVEALGELIERATRGTGPRSGFAFRPSWDATWCQRVRSPSTASA